MNEKTSWGNVAEWYDSLLEDSDDSFQKKVILPNLIRIVSPKKGMAILDVACGQGYFARAFANNGASVIGADISKELVDIATKKADELRLKKDFSGEIEFHVSKSDEISMKIAGLKETGAYFDAVTIILAIQNIERFAETFAECAKLIKPNGRLIVVMNHPSFRIPSNSSWQWDEKAMKQYRRIDAYMSESKSRIEMNPGEKDISKKKYTVTFHRPLQVYFKALNKAGFAVERMEEWLSHKQSEKGPHKAEEDRMRKEIPMFMCLEMRRV